MNVLRVLAFPAPFDVHTRLRCYVIFAASFAGPTGFFFTIEPSFHTRIAPREIPLRCILGEKIGLVN